MATNYEGGGGGGGGGSGGAAPPKSIPSGDDAVWADAAPLIEAACNDLQEGELVHGENFSLFAAMSALEIMDPKMDPGIESSGYCSVDEAIENGIAPVPLSFDRTVDVKHTLDVMDHLLACEATWHNGHSLAQTVFSCIYILRIERTSPHPLLHSYCRVMRATCNAVVSAVSDARTHEEEDLFTMSYGLPLKDGGDDKCLSILNSVEETVSRQLQFESLQTNPDLEEGYCRAVLCRLRFRKHFYHALTCMRKPQGRGLELARKHIAACLSELDNMFKSLDFLRSHSFYQESAVTSTTASGCRPIGFDVSLNSRLLSPTPPRAVKVLSWIDAVSYFEKLLHYLDTICSFSLDPALESVLHFIVKFQLSQPPLVARAHLQLLLVHDGKLYGRDSFSDVIARSLALPDVTKDKEFQTNEFVLQLGQLLINLIKILCANTAWQRRKLGKILQDWSVISIQLELALKREFGELLNSSVDESVCMKVSKHLLMWAQEQTYWIALRFLTLGFELQLYSPSEYCMVYWYMYVIFMKQVETMQIRIVAGTRRKGKKKRDHHARDSGRDAMASSYCLLLQCYMCLSEGLAMMLAALRNESNAFQMPNIFNSEQERFIQHFELLQKAQVPEHISYHIFKESTAHACISDVVKHNYFREAQRIAASLKGSFSADPERLAELRLIEQVAEHNRIALNVINQVGAGDPTLRVPLEFTHHNHFVVAVVKRS
ncbi:N-alpha-acetyltransferase 35, NatC auxiliary subunit [Ananas comosus]|uniref:N-alpha-acetyltransferase 35, NatC auxiliary subunit n=1 Tax=Ananas comosus TaxID=4615 RepID=A0A199UPV3_ANACO|nr:N-alpha-acetyltransferase 35, NatC auxiliary subunit [Ananas comosus]